MRFLPVYKTQAINASEFFNKEYLAAFGRAQANLALLLLARYFFFEEVFSPWHSKQASSAHDLAKTFLSFWILFISWISSCTRHSIQVNLMTLLSLARYFREKRVNGRFLSFVSFAQSVFLCDIMLLAAFLCVICAICGRIITQEYSSNHQRKTISLSQISQIYADKPQNNKTALTSNNLSFSAI